MSEAARITITSGPDRGTTFDLEEEIVHIGHGPENHLDLRDPDVADHQASIVRRNDRFAIFTPLSDTVDVDGSVVPAEKWVWLPTEARIQLTERTTMQFRVTNGGASASGAAPRPVASAGTVDPFADESPGAGPDDSPSLNAIKARPKRKRRAKGAGKGDGKRQVARFITDHSGDTLVKLGEDGKLPELQLAEGRAAKKAERRKDAEGGGNLLYIALGFSVLASAALLLMDLGPGDGGAALSRSRALAEIRTYLGDEAVEPAPYQRHLREAILAAGHGDRSAERKSYRLALDLLNDEDLNPLLGLTGSPDRDEYLRELIGVMLKR